MSGPGDGAAPPGDAGWVLLPDAVRVERDGRVREERLDDPADPAFLRLPHEDLRDGRSLRRAAFDVWRDHVLASVAAGRTFETGYVAPRPFVTALTVVGAAFVTSLCTALLLWWALRPDPAVVVQPTVPQSTAMLVAVLTVLAVIVVSGAACVRAWRCRRGSYVHLGANGLRTVQGGRVEPLAVVAGTSWHALVRCTRITFEDGRPDVWVPAERGALRRVDLLVTAMDDRLADALRRSL